MARIKENEVAPQADTAGFDLTVTEFCTRLSTEDRRVELIGAFHAAETNAGRTKDQESAFRSRFHAFVTKPA